MKRILLAALIAGCLTGWATSARGDGCSSFLNIVLENPVLSGHLTNDNLTVFWTLPEICDKDQWSVDAKIDTHPSSCVYDDDDAHVSCPFSTRELIGDAAFAQMTDEEKRQAVDEKRIRLFVHYVAGPAATYSTHEIRLSRIPIESDVSSPRLRDISRIDPSMYIRPGLSRYSNLIGRVHLLDIAEDEIEADAAAEDAAPPEDDAADDTTTADPSARTDPPPPVPSDDLQGFAVDSDGCTLTPGASSNPAVLLWLVGLIPLALRRR